jgi:hypothetical protein
MKRWLLLCLLCVSLTLVGCAPPCDQDPACTRVLFIGNSYTFYNDLPQTFARLAQAGEQRVETGMAAGGGWTVADHVNSAETLEKITSSKWDYVILQEQSQVPANAEMRAARMTPAARTLVSKIRAAGAQPVFFVPWAHRGGWREMGLSGYESMQLQVNQGYVEVGQELDAWLVPVGFAWLKLWKQNPQLGLWQEDGSHPNEKGTYLAACVFYAALYRQSPEGLEYRSSLSTEDAKVLQKIAAETVLQEPARWNLP